MRRTTIVEIGPEWSEFFRRCILGPFWATAAIAFCHSAVSATDLRGWSEDFMERTRTEKYNFILHQWRDPVCLWCLTNSRSESWSNSRRALTQLSLSHSALTLSLSSHPLSALTLSLSSHPLSALTLSLSSLPLTQLSHSALSLSLSSHSPSHSALTQLSLSHSALTLSQLSPSHSALTLSQLSPSH